MFLHCLDALIEVQNIPPIDITHSLYDVLDHVITLEHGLIFWHHLMNGGIDMAKLIPLALLLSLIEWGGPSWMFCQQSL